MIRKLIQRDAFQLISRAKCQIEGRREIWGWLNSVFNRVDDDRIKEVGPDRACAEWLLRCGAYVKWKDFQNWQKDYNLLPSGNNKKYKIEQIDATDSCVMNIGFVHLKGLKELKKMKLHRCSYLDDTALNDLRFVAGSLEDLQVSSCGNVSDEGILNLTKLGTLRKLFMYDLPEVRNRQKCIDELKKSLPTCEIVFLSREEAEKLRSEIKENEKK